MEQTFLSSVLKRFKDYKSLGDKTFAQLNDAEFHFQPHKELNSLAIIIQHMHGNMLSRFTNFLTEDGEKEWRKRDAEFEEQHLSKEQLLQLWEEGWAVLFDALSQLKPEDVSKTVTIRSEVHPVTDAIIRQIAHYSYHVGQVVYLAKIIKGANWQNLTIARNQSTEYNTKMMGKKQ